MMTTDKPKDADILERVKDILNKKERKKPRYRGFLLFFQFQLSSFDIFFNIPAFRRCRIFLFDLLVDF